VLNQQLNDGVFVKEQTEESLAARQAKLPRQRCGSITDALTTCEQGKRDIHASLQGGREKDDERHECDAYTDDADKDFVSHMIAHHQGTVDMAEVELKYGKDLEMRKLVTDIIKAQKEEIAHMKKWQAKHPMK
jgi:uncharacterized protein (DUF305 family)